MLDPPLKETGLRKPFVQESDRGSEFDEYIEEILGAQLEEEQRLLEQQRAQSIALDSQMFQAMATEKTKAMISSVIRTTNTTPVLRADLQSSFSSSHKTNASLYTRICGFTPSPKTVGRDSPRLPEIVGRSNLTSALRIELQKPQIINPIPIEEAPRLLQPLQQNQSNIEGQVSESSKKDLFRISRFFKVTAKEPKEDQNVLQFDLELPNLKA